MSPPAGVPRRPWRVREQAWHRLDDGHAVQIARFVQAVTGRSRVRFLLLGPPPGPGAARPLVAAGDVWSIWCMPDHGSITTEQDRAIRKFAAAPLAAQQKRGGR